MEAENDLKEIWSYDEPHPSGGNIHITMTKRQAIDWMRSTYKAPGTDEEFFQEFIAVHWAHREVDDAS